MTAGVIGGSMVPSADGAKEPKVALDAVPAVVLRAVRKAAPSVEFTAAEKQTPKDRPVSYKLIGETRRGRAVAVTASSEGEVLAIEEEVPLEEVPINVRRAVARKFSEVGFTSIERVRAGGKVTYAFHGKRDGKALDVIVSHDGRKVTVEGQEPPKD